MGQATFLTWRLHGSLPNSRSFPAELTSVQAFVAMDRLLDGGRYGPHFLGLPGIASTVTEAIRYRDEQAYQLHAFVVMSEPRSSSDESAGDGFQDNAIPQEVHGERGKRNVGADWPVLLAGRKL